MTTSNETTVYFEADKGQSTAPSLSQSPGNCAACNGSAASSATDPLPPDIAADLLEFDPDDVARKAAEKLRAELEQA